MARRRAHRRAALPMGDMFAVGGCDCTCNTPSGQTVTLKGCNSFPFTAGQSINVCTASGCATPISGSPFTTNSSGQISVPTGSHWFIPADGRFTGQTYTVTTGTNTLTFTAATGYVCACPTLWFAFPTTVYWTDSDISAVPLTYSFGWNAAPYDMNGSITGCGTSGSGCTSGTGHPSLSIGFYCGTGGGPSRSWGECTCPGGVYLYETSAVGCSLAQAGSYGANFGFTSTTNPPFYFSGPLSVYQEGNLADPVSGNVVITE